ncbi:MAG TPA: DUF4870 domain-containing protein [Nocardioides sp.]|nr:DUF4870 domain-containing protein [Nocardioides sp.]
MSDPYTPSAATQDDRTWALLSHIGSLVSAWFAFGFIAPLVVMLVKADRPFVRRHAVESLNFQLSLLLYSVVGVVVGFLVVMVTLGVGALVVIPLVAVFALLALVFVVLATVKAGNGEDYRYPLTLRFIR